MSAPNVRFRETQVLLSFCSEGRLWAGNAHARALHFSIRVRQLGAHFGHLHYVDAIGTFSPKLTFESKILRARKQTLRRVYSLQ